MKLNICNYDNDMPEVISSKLTPQMNTRVAVFAYSIEDALSLKLYSILKREFSVVFAHHTHNPYHFAVVDIFDTQYLQAFLTYSRIETIILTSEFLVNLIKNKTDVLFICKFKKILAFCNAKSIKITYIYIKNLFFQSDNEFKFLGLSENDTYYFLNEKVLSCILEYKNNLILKFSTYYGIHDYFPIVDFPEYVYQTLCNNEITYYDSVHRMEPVISDEIALYLSDKMQSTGSIQITDASNFTTQYEWALQIAKQRGYHSDAIKLIKPHSADTKISLIDTGTCVDNTSFSSLSAGYVTELKQKKCAFNLVYKLSPTEYFFGERVAESRIELGKQLASSFTDNIMKEIDYVIPVPKTGVYYAMGLAQQLGKPYIQALTKDTNEVRSFQVLDANVRKEIIKNKIIPIPELFKDKKIILVDEAIFTGTTLKVVCKMVRDCGAREIHLGIPTPECRNQCPYYVQPKRAMLLEYMKRNMLEEYFNVESIFFQKQHSFTEIISSFGNACMQCFANDKEGL